MATVIPATLTGKFFLTLFASMIPVTELRAGIPFGYGMGLPIWAAFLAAVIGNMIPIPFILIFLRKIFDMMKRSERFAATAEKFEKKGHLKGEKVRRYGPIGLALFVAIPLPGTGGWTGALVASVLDIDRKKAIWSILAGILIAGVIVSLITVGAFSFL